MNIRIWTWKLCLVWGKTILSTVSTQLLACVNCGWLCLPSVSSLGQGSGFVEWADCFPLCGHLVSAHLVCIRLFSQPASAAFPYPALWGCVWRAAVPHSLELLSEDWWRRAWTGLIPIGVICSEQKPSLLPRAWSLQQWQIFQAPV